MIFIILGVYFLLLYTFALTIDVYRFNCCCLLSSSNTMELERSLESCLRIFFIPNDKETLVIVRFWKPLMYTLLSCVSKGTYSSCSIEMQVHFNL